MNSKVLLDIVWVSSRAAIFEVDHLALRASAAALLAEAILEVDDLALWASAAALLAAAVAAAAAEVSVWQAARATDELATPVLATDELATVELATAVLATDELATAMAVATKGQGAHTVRRRGEWKIQTRTQEINGAKFVCRKSNFDCQAMTSAGYQRLSNHQLRHHSLLQHDE